MSNPISFTALTAFAADANSAAIALSPAACHEVTIYHGAGVTFGSGTLKLQTSPDGGTTWVDVSGATWTTAVANRIKQVFSPVYGTQLRVALTGSTSPVLNVSVRVARLKFGVVTPVLPITADIAGTVPFTVQPTPNSTILGAPLQDFAVFAWGTWGSGTLTLQSSPDGGTTWFDAAAGITANALTLWSGALMVDTLYRFKVTGSTAPALSVIVIS